MIEIMHAQYLYYRLKFLTRKDKKMLLTTYLNINPTNMHLFSVLHGLVECLQPHVAQGDERVRVVLGARPGQDSLKLLLAWAPLLLGQMQVADQ